MGCIEHHEEIRTNFIDKITRHCIINFCKEINDLLHSKDKEICDNFKGIQIFEVALSFRKRNKKIGKYTDIFNNI